MCPSALPIRVCQAIQEQPSTPCNTTAAQAPLAHKVTDTEPKEIPQPRLSEKQEVQPLDRGVDPNTARQAPLFSIEGQQEIGEDDTMQNGQDGGRGHTDHVLPLARPTTPEATRDFQIDSRLLHPACPPAPTAEVRSPLRSRLSLYEELDDYERRNPPRPTAPLANSNQAAPSERGDRSDQAAGIAPEAGWAPDACAPPKVHVPTLSSQALEEIRAIGQRLSRTVQDGAAHNRPAPNKYP